MAVFFLAGIAAERRYNPQAQNTSHWTGDQEAYFRLFPDGKHNVEHWIAAQQLLDRNWSAVDAVASALLDAENFSLPPDDVESIVKQYPAAAKQGTEER